MLERFAYAPCPACAQSLSPEERVSEESFGAVREDAFSVERLREWLLCSGCRSLLSVERTDLVVASILGRERIPTWEEPALVATGAYLKRLLERVVAGEPIPEGLTAVRSIPEFARALGLPRPKPVPPPRSELETVVGVLLGVATGIMAAATVRRR